MNEKKESLKEKKERFEKEQNVIDLVKEYGINNGMSERFAIGSILSEEELMKQYPDVYPLYKPCKRLDVDTAKAIKELSLKEENGNRKQRKNCVSLDQAKYEGAEFGKLDSNIERLADEEYSPKTIKKLNRLSEKQRERLIRYSNGETYEEIAASEGKCVSSVFESIENAREKMGRKKNL